MVCFIFILFFLIQFNECTNPATSALPNASYIYKKISTWKEGEKLGPYLPFILPQLTVIPVPDYAVDSLDHFTVQISKYPNLPCLKYIDEAQKRFASYYREMDEFSTYLLALKRSYHLTFVSFAVKLLMVILSLEETVKRYDIEYMFSENRTHAITELHGVVTEFNTHCLPFLHQHVDPTSWSDLNTVTVEEVYAAHRMYTIKIRGEPLYVYCGRRIMDLQWVYENLYNSTITHIEVYMKVVKGFPQGFRGFELIEPNLFFKLNHDFRALGFHLGEATTIIAREYEYFQGYNTGMNFPLYYRLMLNFVPIENIDLCNKWTKKSADVLEDIQRNIYVSRAERPILASKYWNLRLNGEFIEHVQEAKKDYNWLVVNFTTTRTTSRVQYVEYFMSEKTTIMSTLAMVYDIDSVEYIQYLLERLIINGWMTPRKGQTYSERIKDGAALPQFKKPNLFTVSTITADNAELKRETISTPMYRFLNVCKKYVSGLDIDAPTE
ncbi:hypothetical protein SNEBB_003827 [Seison nebaliae]|nr:hypothetical protein SNEBB_003827 [Seison nebaliae]